MKYIHNEQGYKFTILNNYPNKKGYYRVVHNNINLFKGCILNTIDDCISEIKYIVARPNQYIIKKGN